MNILENDYNYLLGLAGDTIYINGGSTPLRALINNLPVNRQADIRTISCTSNIKRGDIITWDSQKWIILSEIGAKRNGFYKGIIQRLNTSVKFFDNKTGDVLEYPAIISASIYDIVENKFIPLATGKVSVIMQVNEFLSLNKRFIKFGDAYKIMGIDKTEIGLLKLSCDLDTFQTNDNQLLEIADYTPYIWEIRFTNGTESNLLNSKTLQLETEIKRNGEVYVPSDGIVYSTSDSLMATVNESGLITPIGYKGYVTITATYKNVSTSILVTIIENNTNNYNIAFNPIFTSMTISETKTITATVTNNGVVDNNVSVEFYLRNKDGSSNVYATMTHDFHTATITAKNFTSKYIIIRAELIQDRNIFLEKEIKIISLV